MPRGLDGWRATQRRTRDGAIDSEQQIRAPAPVVQRSAQGAAALGHAYWEEVTRASRGVIRARERADGVVLRLGGIGPALLRLGPAQLSGGPEVSATYPILGGLLAKAPGGVLVLSQSEEERPLVVTAVRGFHPRLAARRGRPRITGALYDLVQRRLHVAISRRYLHRLLAEGAR